MNIQGNLVGALPYHVLFSAPQQQAVDGRLYVNFDSTNVVQELDMETLSVIRTVTSYHQNLSIAGCGANSENIYFFNSTKITAVRLSDGVQIFHVDHNAVTSGYYVESIHADENGVYIVRAKSGTYEIDILKYNKTTGAYYGKITIVRTDGNRIQNVATISDGRTFFRFSGNTFEVNPETFNLLNTVATATSSLSGGNQYIYSKNGTPGVLNKIDPNTLLIIDTTSTGFPTGATRMAIQKTEYTEDNTILLCSLSDRPIGLDYFAYNVIKDVAPVNTTSAQRCDASSTTFYVQRRDTSTSDNYILEYDVDTFVITATSNTLPITGWSNGLGVSSSGRIYAFVDGTTDMIYEIDKDTLLPVNSVASPSLFYDLACSGEELIATKESDRIYTLDPDTLLSTGYTTISGYTVGSNSRLGGGDGVYYVRYSSSIFKIDADDFSLISTGLGGTAMVGVCEVF